MIDVSEQVIWQYENYYTSRKLQNINELKTIFNVKGLYFYREDMLERYERSNNIPLMNIAYRSNTMNVISKTQTCNSHYERAHLVDDPAISFMCRLRKLLE